VALIDIGGGSTEVVTATRGDQPSVMALAIGAATLAGRHVTADPPLPDEVAAMRADARSAVAALPGIGVPTALAVGGTADNLARIAGSGTLTTDSIAWILGRLGEMTAEEAAAAFGVRVARARLLPAGAAILLAVLERWGSDEVEVSPAGLREGALLAVASAGRGWRDRLPALVGASLGVNAGSG
jgi:exopolyphosphatase/guanosine-5'-triphosphate,3'-diphosphate pyrophosphatase